MKVNFVQLTYKAPYKIKENKSSYLLLGPDIIMSFPKTKAGKEVVTDLAKKLCSAWAHGYMQSNDEIEGILT